MVLVIPLWFFNSLLKTALEKASESSLGLLREEILQTAENVRLAMKPDNFVKDVAREIHRELLPQVTPDIIRMVPVTDFGKNIFDSKLPGKLLRAFRQRGLDTVLIHVDTPEFEESSHWYSDELTSQCREPVNLALDLTMTNYIAAAELYYQQYQKPWPRHYKLPQNLQKAFQINRKDYIFAYLSRFSEMLGAHDRVDEFYTDYFEQQSIYRYSYYCMSPVTLHGAYTVFVPQRSINPEAILKHAVSIIKPGFSISLTRSAEEQAGFINVSEGIDYYVKAPSEFWSHLLFSRRLSQPSDTGKNTNLIIKISGRHQPAIQTLEAQYALFRLASAIVLIFYSAWSFRFWLFGFSLQLSTRRKLVMILGLIVILPIFGVGSLTFLALRSAERVLETHLGQQALNNVRDVALLNEENLLGQMGTALEVKRRIENNASDETDLFKIIDRPAENPLWFSTWTNTLAEGQENGMITNYSGFKEKAPVNRLVNSLVAKYQDSLGLLKTGKRSDFSQTMTLGLMENYITPEQEEASVVHENTAQRALTHSADTTKSVLYVARDRKGRYRLLYHRVANIGEHVYRHLSYKANNEPFWFTRSGRYGDVSVGVRLRKLDDLFMFSWPGDALLSPEMTANFERALATRDFGQSVIRSDNEFEVRAWRYKDGESAVISAVGKNRGVNFAFAGLAINMLFPILMGYAVLLLYFIASIIVEFISGPVKIINKGIEALSHENYGVMISSFSEDEFDKVTQAFNEMSIALKQREMIKRYVSGALVEHVQSASANDLVQESRTVRVTILASDIRGFTAISEKYSPAEVVEMLNSYFTSMEEAITEYGGVIDKYIGDAVQAVFYNEPALENDVIRACRAAVSMRQKLAQLNAERTRQGLFTIDNGVGIDTGMVVSGSIGSETGRKDYTVTGKVIEQAAALESMTSMSESRILLSLDAGREAESAITCRVFNAEALELINV